ncbi:MAG: response regulator [Oscillospiraceae bacterium]|nr:response regulator [Oscillospiraceae bacterium]
MKRIFIIDDNEANLFSARTALDDTYEIFAAQSAERMFKLLEKITPDLILLDIEMPEMDGFEALKILKEDERYRSIPVIFLTGKHDSASELRGFELGAVDFINKPFATLVLLRRIKLHIETDELIKESRRDLEQTHNATIEVMANMVERRDEITGGHIARTQKYLEILINELLRTGTYADEISGWDMGMLLPSAQLHDIGKIAISDLILNKPAKLTDEEFGKIKQHCGEGESIIDEIIAKTKNNSFLTHAKRFAGYHHEKWNGKGYPIGLSGEEIPLEGRIMAIADVYDALVSERPYKQAFTHDRAVEIIKGDSGIHFDPKIVEAFLNVAEDFWVQSQVAHQK